MPPLPLSFGMIPHLKVSMGRGIGILEGDQRLNAASGFLDLTEKQEWLLRARMELWVDGKNGPDGYFHGFPNDPDHASCFVFKLKERRVGHRFYGFLCNPQPVTNPRFRLCVLNIHSLKTEFETDLADLERVNGWRMNWRASEAITRVYPEYRKGPSPWKN